MSDTTPPVTFHLDNINGSAFVGESREEEDGERDDYTSRTEVARLLREAADKIEGGADNGVLYDINGAKVGQFDYNPLT